MTTVLKAKPLTRTQELDLKALADRPHCIQAGYGCTNRTMAALEARGLVKFHWQNVLKSRIGSWKITETGRRFLAQQ